jgi:hypothetical protein
MNSDSDKIDRAVLALLWLTAFRQKKNFPWQAWKGHDWDALERLHEARWISDPRNKNKSITFSDAGAERARALFEEMFGAGPQEIK